MTNLNPSTGSEQVNLAAYIGKRPVLLFYWIPGNPRADQVFKEVRQLVESIGDDKVKLLVAAYPRPGRGVDMVEEGIRRLSIDVPVLEDTDFTLGRRLRVQSVPNLTILDKEGRLQLTNGASLAQVLEYKLDLAGAIKRVAEKGELGTYGYLARYHPVKELVGQACPDFKAPLISTSVERSFASLLDDSKPNVIIFWSVDCPHCRNQLPELSAWLQQNPELANVISAAKVNSDEARARTKEFCEVNQLAFKTLVDQDQRISSKFHVTSTPTFVIISPDGIVESVALTNKALQRKLQEARRKS